jgi:heme exporter protein A
MPTSPVPSLRVHALVVARGDRTVLAGLSFALSPGEILHVRGGNGAGKTSLLEVLCGLRPPAAGRLEGQPLPAERHWIGHKNALNPTLTPRENLRFWCALNGVGVADVDAALERAGLKAQRARPCGALSIGQRRRAALARLCAVTRPWWFLDEPLAGLDRSAIGWLAELLHAHVRAGGAALLTSHQALPQALSRGVRELELGR